MKAFTFAFLNIACTNFEYVARCKILSVPSITKSWLWVDSDSKVFLSWKTCC